MLEKAIKSMQRIRDCRFSSAVSNGRPSKITSNDCRNRSYSGSMEIVSQRQPRLDAICFASFVELCAVNREGRRKQTTFSFPTARTARWATSAESIPPDSPKWQQENPHPDIKSRIPCTRVSSSTSISRDESRGREICVELCVVIFSHVWWSYRVINLTISLFSGIIS